MANVLLDIFIIGVYVLIMAVIVKVSLNAFGDFIKRRRGK